MTVYNKIVRIKPVNQKARDPMPELRGYLRTHPGIGIDCLILGRAEGLGETTVEFICSDANPSQPRTMKDIDNLLMHFNVTKVIDSHRSDPKDSGATNHRLQISTDKAPDKDDNEETKEVERD